MEHNAELTYDLQNGTMPEPEIVSDPAHGRLGTLITLIAWNDVIVNFKHLNKKVAFTCDIRCDIGNEYTLFKLKKFEMVDINTGEEIQPDHDPVELVKDYLAKNLTITLDSSFPTDGLNTDECLGHNIKVQEI